MSVPLGSMFWAVSELGTRVRLHVDNPPISASEPVASDFRGVRWMGCWECTLLDDDFDFDVDDDSDEEEGEAKEKMGSGGVLGSTSIFMTEDRVANEINKIRSVRVMLPLNR